MSHLELIRRFALVLGLVLLAGSVKAQDVEEPQPEESQQLFEPRNFKSSIQQVEVAGWEQIRRVLITCGTNEFSLIVPHGFRTTTATDKVMMAANDGSYFLSFRVLMPTLTSATTGNGYHRQLADQFPKATIVGEYTRDAGGHAGTAFTLRGRVGGSVDRTLRVVFVPTRIGVLEFVMNADIPKSAEAEVAFNSVLRAFRTNERSRLEVVVRTLDKS